MNYERENILSIIIVNWNTEDLLRSCLESIYNETKNITYEIFVIDNASSDSSLEFITNQFPQVKLIRNNINSGYAKACNQGIKISKGKYILLLNPDTVILNNALEKLISFADKTPSAGIFGPKLINKDGSLQLSCRIFPKVFFKSYMLKIENAIANVDWLVGACLLIRREVINDVGYIDEDFFMYGEDMDFCYRAKKRGWNCLFYPLSEVLHVGNVSGDKKWGITRIPKAWYGSTLKFHKKHHNLFVFNTYRFSRAVVCLIRVIYYTLLSIFNKKFSQKKKIFRLSFLICLYGSDSEVDSLLKMKYKE